jgi:hypothetical protein
MVIIFVFHCHVTTTELRNSDTEVNEKSTTIADVALLLVADLLTLNNAAEPELYREVQLIATAAISRQLGVEIGHVEEFKHGA